MIVERQADDSERRFAPYAPASTALKVIRHFRNREVPERLTPTMLMQLDVTENLVPRVIRALQFIGLIDDTFATTPDFRRIPSADDREYQQLLQGLLRTAYREIFQIANVEDAPRETLIKAFLLYAPASQRERMVILFTELAREAGMRVSGTEEEPRMTAPRLPIRKRASNQPPARQSAGQRAQSQGGIHPSILALLDVLPHNGGVWTKGSRDRWLRALEGVLDYLHPTTEQPETETEE